MPTHRTPGPSRPQQSGAGAATVPLVAVRCVRCSRTQCEVAPGTRYVRFRCRRCGEWQDWRGPS